MTISRDIAAQSLAPVCIGPTWRRDANGAFDLPEYSLGWGAALWAMKNLRRAKGVPWTFTPEQLRFIVWFYAVDEEGEFLRLTAVLQRLKGWGKDPLACIITLIELCGPCRFSHWEEMPDGQLIPIGKQAEIPSIILAAVTKEQTRNTTKLYPVYMPDSFIAEYGIEVLKEHIRSSATHGEIRAVTSSPRTIEGDRTTFALLNETHHWISTNSGHDMYDVIEGNRTKMGGRWLAITNAYQPGDDSVAQRLRETYEKQIEFDGVSGLLYDSLEAPSTAELTKTSLETWIPTIRGDATWLKVGPIIQSIMNPANPVSRSRRMWLNQIVAEDDALYSPYQWDAMRSLEDPLLPGHEVVLGFDGSKSRDATALMAVRVKDGHAVLLHIQERPDGPDGKDWEVDKEKVQAAIADAIGTYKVRAFFADVAYWESWISSWNDRWGGRMEIRACERSAIGWDMRSRKKDSTEAHERLLSSVRERSISHDGNATLRRHALNAYRRENNYGVSFGKDSPSSKKKVDAYAALMLAHEAWIRLREARSKKVTAQSRVWIG